MKKFFLHSIVLIILISLSNCGNKATLPSSSGRTAEILVVTDKSNWNSLIGKTLRDYFEQEQVGLPQPEPIFKLLCLSSLPERNAFRSHHNILIIDVIKEIKKPMIEIKKDVWSTPQLVVKIAVPSDSSFINIFNNYKESLTNTFTDIERTRINTVFSQTEKKSLCEILKRDFAMKMNFPEEFFIAKQTKDFIWFRKEGKTFSQGIMIYSHPYTDTASFELSKIILLRDSITKRFIPGALNGTYMVAATRFVQPDTKRVSIDHCFAIETRGLWEVKGDFMGGPFLNYTIADTLNKRVLTIDAYVYNPQDEKRNMLLQLEAIIYSLKIQ